MGRRRAGDDVLPPRPQLSSARACWRRRCACRAVRFGSPSWACWWRRRGRSARSFPDRSRSSRIAVWRGTRSSDRSWPVSQRSGRSSLTTLGRLRWLPPLAAGSSDESARRPARSTRTSPRMSKQCCERTSLGARSAGTHASGNDERYHGRSRHRTPGRWQQRRAATDVIACCREHVARPYSALRHTGRVPSTLSPAAMKAPGRGGGRTISPTERQHRITRPRVEDAAPNGIYVTGGVTMPSRRSGRNPVNADQRRCPARSPPRRSQRVLRPIGHDQGAAGYGERE